MRSMTEGGPQPPIRNITQRSISRYGRFRIVFSCGQIDISSEKVRNTGAADVFLEIVMQPFLGFDDIVPDSSSPATV